LFVYGLAISALLTSSIKHMKKIETTHSSYCFRGTRFGPVGILWSVHLGQPKIRHILLSKPGLSAKQVAKSLFSDSIFTSCAEVDVVADQIAAFLAGTDIRFSLDIACLDLCSAFQQKVLRAEHGIPRGSVSTYQRIAKHLGNAQGARAVGTALAYNPFPIIVPCHRAIRSDGTLGGFQGGLEMKRALLEMEGVLFNGLDRVVSGHVFY
jgi:methylated-DNA-[protein]-cysteine S-methyltransferase